MSRHLLRRFLVLVGLAPVALAADPDAPPGFTIETRPAGGALLLSLPDGSDLLSTGNFGSATISRRLPDGTEILFATGFGSLAGAALSPVTGELLVGDSWGSPVLRMLTDLNADLDCLDAGEHLGLGIELPILANLAAPLPYDLTFRPGTNELYVSGSTPFGVSPTMGVVVKVADGNATVFGDDFGFTAGIEWSGDTLYVADVSASTFVGHVVTLRDRSGDGDALDAGEAREFATGLSGANDLVVAQDGSIYLSGMIPSASSSVGRLAADGDGDGLSDAVDETFLTGFAFSGGLELVEGAGGFVPGAGGDGMLVVSDLGFDGDYLVRTAPLAELSLSGTVANNSVFTLTVGGEAGAGALLVLSLDQADVTLKGIGDLGLGFSAPHVILGLAPLGPAGTSLSIPLHGVGALVGTAFAAQGFTLQGGEIGIADALDLVIAP